MGVELEMVLENIQYQIDSYRKRLMEITTGEKETGIDTFESEKYLFYIQCLEKLYKDLVYPSVLRKQHILECMLESDYDGGWDTKVIFKDESSMVIKFDDYVKCVDGFLVFYDKAEYENDTTVIPSVIRLICLDEIREVYRLEE